MHHFRHLKHRAHMAEHGRTKWRVHLRLQLQLHIAPFQTQPLSVLAQQAGRLLLPWRGRLSGKLERLQTLHIACEAIANIGDRI